MVIGLQDNSPVVGCFSKGRSPSFLLNRMVRMKAAACMAANLRMLLPWIQTNLQPADDDSRLI